ncbi:MAG: hypothetical protein A2Y10_00065 [Planctomycetes bacterium GWF2_41_51]|nr:MAG: hypothetical protein A2Y10_00065 [Planctomycetes bacterium GWF2_41_51]HBG28635.1 hypothetical protein [Phycisphaerales bacterium]
MRIKILAVFLTLSALHMVVNETHACYQPPVAVLQAIPEYAITNVNVILDASDSYDTDLSKIIKFEWDWTNDGTYDYNETSVSAGDGIFDGKAEHFYNSGGVYTIRLRVTDDENTTDTVTCTVYTYKVINITQKTGFDNIQSAINNANNSDTIIVQEGTYYNTIDFNGKSCTLQSTNPDDWDVIKNTIIDVNAPDANGVEFDQTENSNSVFKGFTITGGGRGIYCSGASPTISNCLIKNNLLVASGAAGGGMYCINSSKPTIRNCIFVGNSISGYSSSPHVGGGGMYCENSEPNIINCIFDKNFITGNFGNHYGAGIYNKNSNSKIVNSIFYNNVLFWPWAECEGGGIYNYNSSPVITNCEFIKNVAQILEYEAQHGKGGAIYNVGSLSKPKISNSIFWSNSAYDAYAYDYEYSGHSIYNENSADPNVRNCVIEGGLNNPPGCEGEDSTDDGGNIASEPNFINIDSLYGPDSMPFTWDDGLQLQLNSNCIDAGYGDSVHPTDITGKSRVDVEYVTNNGSGNPDYVDIGAYEASTLWFVNENAEGSGDNGTSWYNAYTDLQDALSQSDSGDEIWVAKGTYEPNDNNDRFASFQLISNTGVYGGFNGDEIGRIYRNWTTYPTILSGDINTVNNMADNSYHVVKGADNAVLDGFIIAYGNANGSSSNGYGGGIHCNGTSPVIRNCIIRDCNAVSGGGGIYIYNSSTIENPTFINCFITGNKTNGNGGGVYNQQAALNMINCVNHNNYAETYGGGIYCYAYYSKPQITNCTLTENSAGNRGGGLWIYQPVVERRSRLTNCIIWDNTAAVESNEVYSGGGHFSEFSYCCIKDSNGSGANWDLSLGIDGGGNNNSDPCFVNPSDPNGEDNKLCTSDDGFGLQEDSPCIDAGNNMANAELLDISQNKRKLNNYVDIGAYEYNCFDASIFDVQYNQENITDPDYGWQDESFICDPTTFSVAFKVENSGNCFGDNYEIQSGTCDVWIYLPFTKTITLSLKGNTERRNQEYDFGLIYVDEAENPEVWISGTTEGEGCGTEETPKMMVHNSSVCPYNAKCQEAYLTEDFASDWEYMQGHIPESQVTLGKGMHHIRFKVTTGWDGAYHTDEYFNFSIIVQNP